MTTAASEIVELHQLKFDVRETVIDIETQETPATLPEEKESLPSVHGDVLESSQGEAGLMDIKLEIEVL